jgi:SAM-dependent methyltransferase
MSTYNANLSYQAFGEKKGGSDTTSKLAAIQLPDLRGKRFLDLGCNAGYFCGLAEEAGAKALGIDSSPNVIRLARERYPNIEFRDTGWDKFPDGEFDVVISLSAIHYAKDPLQLVSNIANHLAPDGLFILEGGIVDENNQYETDTLIPVFRTVGDRVRHNSHGFLQRHLLRNFDWKVIGPSVEQRGDPIRRYVIHGKRAASANQDPDYRLDFVEFAKALSLSSQTIRSEQPSFGYVTALGGRSEINEESLEEIFAADAARGAFLDDVAFSLKGCRGAKLRVDDKGNRLLSGQLVEGLRQRGVEVVTGNL